MAVHLNDLLLGVLTATNLPIVSGLRSFEGKPALRCWMLAPLAGCAAVHVAPAPIGGDHPAVRACLALRHERRIHAAVLALLDGAIRAFPDIAFANRFAALVRARDQVRWDGGGGALRVSHEPCRRIVSYRRPSPLAGTRDAT